MDLHKEGVYRDGTIDEKVTVISSLYIRTYVHTYIPSQVGSWKWDQCYFFVTEAGNASAALGNIHEDDGHILK